MSDFLLPDKAVPSSQPMRPLQQLLRANSVGQEATSRPDCQIEVQVGIFFDGTNNNKKRDQEGDGDHLLLTRDEETNYQTRVA